MIIIKSILNALFIMASITYSLKSLCGLQQNAYRPKFKLDNLMILTTFVLILVLIPLSIIAIFQELVASIILIVVLFGFSGYNIYLYCKRRTKFKLTSRGSRLLGATALLISIIMTIFSAILRQLWSEILVLTILLLISEQLAWLSCFIMYPFEKLNNNRYIKQAKERLLKLNAVKIGITGSFGKTSCKNILSAMLEKKYKVVKTASSFNTPMGICLSVNSIKGDEEVFIAEMGARRIGDIKELCDIVKPSFAIITGVSNQHLESFKSKENIYKTKKELVDSIPQNGFVVFNGDNALSKKMIDDCKSGLQMVHLTENSGIYAKNIKLTNSGSSFCVSGLKEEFNLTTKLLGKHNILNILMCLTLADHLGVSKEDIIEAVNGLKPIPHRLELVENTRGITIIDDSYNANIDGAGFALEVLKQFSGRKVLFTQGIVELGDTQYDINVNLGVMAAVSADVVLLTGENANAISEGLEKGGFLGEIHYFKTFNDVKDSFNTLLKQGDTLLIQNDIP